MSTPPRNPFVGLKVGAQKGTIQSQLIQSALPESELFELEKYPALALEVQNGNIAGLVVDQAVGEALVATSNGASGSLQLRLHLRGSLLR